MEGPPGRDRSHVQPVPKNFHIKSRTVCIEHGPHRSWWFLLEIPTPLWHFVHSGNKALPFRPFVSMQEAKSGELFSHIGGLLGCCLGVSVFTFTNIIEKVFWKAVSWKMDKIQKSPAAEHLD
ncbi:hypothetical protein AVEN_137338-1 [Araneus ventricosus]|uniref:Uncharacterized protein n=1 Tax=Araneus ventricosus TaxID=182803 RepID=A0A4Y2FKF8_ARAVE|nr:hypothetical protein AVEN_137338-1 [Araneus ventricosus]